MRRKGVAESCASTAMRRRRRLHRRHPTQHPPPAQPALPRRAEHGHRDQHPHSTTIQAEVQLLTPCITHRRPRTPGAPFPGRPPETPLSGADPVTPTAGIRTTRGVAGTARWWCRAWCVLRTGSAPAGCVWPRCAVCVGCPAERSRPGQHAAAWCRRRDRAGGLRVSGGRDKAGRHDRADSPCCSWERPRPGTLGRRSAGH